VSHPLLDLSEGRLLLRWKGARRLPFFYCTPDPAPDRVRSFGEAGVTGVSFAATADFHPYGLAAPAWLEDGRYDWSELDRRARSALSGFGDAMLLLRVHLCSPPWWDALHPGELVVWDGNRREQVFLHGYRKATCASWSSRPWRAAASENLRQLLLHARAQDWGSNVGGVLVAAGNTEEWFQIGTMEGYLPDYSDPARDAFRSWLAGRDAGDRPLAARWGIAATPADAEVPPPEKRRPKRSCFRDPAKDAWAMDFEDFLADEAASFIGELCEVVHEASAGAWFAGAFFGYLTEMVFHGDGVLHGGHLGLTRALADPRIDFLASPGSYARRDLRAGATQSMLPVRAAMEAGKAVFHENDVRTHVLYDDAGYGWTEGPEGTNSAQRREAAFALAHGAGLWWFDMTGTFYDDPTTIETIARLCRAAALPRPPRSPAPIAFVIDEASFGVTDFWPDRYADAIPRQLLELARVGAPHDVRLLSEIPEDHGYRFLLFPNAFRAEPPRVERIRRLVARAGGALFVGPAGLAPVLSGTPPGPAALTGLPIDVRPGPCFVEIALLRGVLDSEPDAPAAFGRRFWHEARVVGDRARVEVLGTHAGGDDPAFFEGLVGGARVSYAADAIVPAAAIRYLARRAGVPVAIGGGDAFASDGSFFAVTAATGGAKRIRVPAPGPILCADPPVPVEARDGVLTVTIAAGETLAFVARAAAPAT
jgi:hypothetical protein